MPRRTTSLFRRVTIMPTEGIVAKACSSELGGMVVHHAL